MVGIAFVFDRRARFERQFDRERRLPRGETRPIGDSEDVCVYRDCGLAEGDIQHHVRGLASDAGERLQGCPIARNLAAILLREDTAQRH